MKATKHHEKGTSDSPWASIVKAFRRFGKKVPESPAKEAAEEVMVEVDETRQAVEEAITQTHEAVALTKMKVAELRAMAKERGFMGCSSMRKADLIALLS